MSAENWYHILCKRDAVRSSFLGQFIVQFVEEIQESAIKRFHILWQFANAIDVPPENKEFSHQFDTYTNRNNL